MQSTSRRAVICFLLPPDCFLPLPLLPLRLLLGAAPPLPLPFLLLCCTLPFRLLADPLACTCGHAAQTSVVSIGLLVKGTGGRQMAWSCLFKLKPHVCKWQPPSSAHKIIKRQDQAVTSASDVAARSSGRQAAGRLASPTVTGEPVPLPDTLHATNMHYSVSVRLTRGCLG